MKRFAAAVIWTMLLSSIMIPAVEAANLGEYLYSLTGASDPRFVFKYPSHVRLAPDGNVIIVEGGTIYLYSPAGDLLNKIDNTGQNFREVVMDESGLLYARTDSFVYVYDAEGNRLAYIPGAMNITGMALDGGGLIYILCGSYEYPSIFVYETDGDYVRDFSIKQSYNQQFGGMAMGPDGNLYLLDWRNGYIHICTTGGSYVGSLGSDLTGAEDISIDARGIICVTDARNHVVTGFGTGSVPGFSLAAVDSNGISYTPRSAAAANDGTLYVADGQRILVYPVTEEGFGTPEEWFGGGAMMYNWGMATDEGGNVYVATDHPGSTGSRIFVYDARGRLLRSWLPMVGQSTMYAILIAADPYGNVYIPGAYYEGPPSYQYHQGIFVFDQYGTYKYPIQMYNPITQMLAYPFGVAYGPSGIWVTESPGYGSSYVVGQGIAWPGDETDPAQMACIINATYNRVIVSHEKWGPTGSVFHIDGLDTSGNLVYSIKGAEGQYPSSPLIQPHGQALDGLGNLFVSDNASDFIGVFDAQSGYSRSGFFLSCNQPECGEYHNPGVYLIATDYCGTKIYASHSYNGSVKVYQGPGNEYIQVYSQHRDVLQTSPEGAMVNLNSGYAYINCGRIVSYLWEWEGGSSDQASTNIMLGPGEHVVKLTVISATGNTASGEIVFHVSDGYKPYARLSAEGTQVNGWFTSDVKVSISGSDYGTGVKEIHYRLDGGPDIISQNNPVNFTITEEGRHLVSYYPVDWAGNRDDSSGRFINIDKTGPEINYVLDGTANESGVFTSNVTVKVTAVEPLSPFQKNEYTVNGVYKWTGYASYSYTLTDNGTYDISLVAWNNINLSTLKEFTVRIDKAPPATTAAVSGTEGDNGWHVSPVTVTLDAASQGAAIKEVRYSINGGTETVVPGSHAEFVLADGVYTVAYGAENVFGTKETMKSLALKVDAMPPSTAATVAGTAGLNGWHVSAVTVTLAASDAGSGVREIRYSVNGVETVVSGASAVIELTGDGLYDLSWQAKDQAGLLEAVQTSRVKIDRTPPEITIGGVSDGAVYELGLVPAASYGSTDALSGPASASASLTGGDGMGLGLFSYGVEARDLAGNVANASASFTVIATPKGTEALVNAMVDSGEMGASGAANVLLQGLINAQEAYLRDNETAGDNRLEALMNYIEAQTGKNISENAALLLLHAIDYMIAQ